MKIWFLKDKLQRKFKLETKINKKKGIEEKILIILKICRLTEFSIEYIINIISNIRTSHYFWVVCSISVTAYIK